MNSVLQVLYMNPIFRKVIFSIPLYKESLEAPDHSIIESGQKHRIMSALQRLFAQLNLSLSRAKDTKELTTSFYWNAAEGTYQHDSQEFIRLILFEVLERILYDTQHEKLMKDMFEIKTNRILHCKICGTKKKAEETGFDIILQVKNIGDIYSSLYCNFGQESEEIISDYYCEVCDKKVDVGKSHRIKELPLFLFINLNRFEYNPFTDKRKKINSRFEFPLELNMTPYIDEIKQGEIYDYELNALVIHRGDCYRGHYISYIRDLLKEGHWDLPKLAEYEKNPEIIEVKSDEPSDKQTSGEKETHESKQIPNEELYEGANLGLDGIEEIIYNEEEEYETNENDSKNNKNSNKKNNKKQNQKKGKNNNRTNKANKSKPSQKTQQKSNKQESKSFNLEKEDDSHRKMSFDKCDYPIKYTNGDLAENWFCFDDTSIFPIRVGRIQKQFQSSESAYMLFYVKKGAKFENSSPNQYFRSVIELENKEMTDYKEKYDLEAQSLLLNIASPGNFYINEFGVLSVLDQVEKNSVPAKFKFQDSVRELLVKADELKISEHAKVSDVLRFSILKFNGAVVLEDRISYQDFEKSFEERTIAHNSYLLLVEKDTEIHSFIKNIENVDPLDPLMPVTFSLKIQEEEKQFQFYSNEVYPTLKEYIKNKFKIEYEFCLIFKIGSKATNLDKAAYDSKKSKWFTLKQLKLADKTLHLIRKDTIVNFEEVEFIPDDEKLKVFAKLEEDESKVNILNCSIFLTFREFHKFVARELGIEDEIRIRKEIDSVVVFQEELDNELTKDPVFLEGDVRIIVEVGEIYKRDEILLKIMFDNHNNETLIQDFIGNPADTKVNDIKNIICNSFGFDPDSHKLYTTNYMMEVNKEIKAEDKTIKQMKLMDGDLLYLKNFKTLKGISLFVSIYIEDKSYDMFINEISSNKLNANTNPELSELNEIYKYDHVFSPIFDSNLKFVIEFTKDTTVDQVKECILSKLKPEFKGKISNERLRVRIVSKRMEPQTILRKGQQLKKLNLDIPTFFYVEVTDYDEDLKENELSLFLFERKEGAFHDKRPFVLEFTNPLTTTELYEKIAKHVNNEDILLAKYQKPFYTWEVIPNTGESLKKSQYNLKDGDFICYRRNDSEARNDNFQSNEDLIIKALLGKLKGDEDEVMANKDSKGKKIKKVKEKALKINLDF